jgi:RNA polymerase sigma factor (sigma-70 family)
MAGNGNFHEQQWALAFQEGDEAALAFFYGQFHPALTIFACRWVKDTQTAQEIASEAFVKTWKMNRKLNSYAGIRAYLYKVVQRAAFRVQLRQQQQPELLNICYTDPENPDNPFEHLVRAETYRMVHNALKSLSPGNHRVISMHFLEGKTTGEIARELNLHPHTVQTQKARGLKALRKIMQEPLFIPVYLIVKFFFPHL